MVELVDTLIEGGYVISMNEADDVCDPGTIAIRDGWIVEVGPVEDLRRRYDAEHRIDGRRMAVLPGLIDTYGHAGHGLIRAVWHARHGWPPGEVYFDATTPEWWYADARLAAVERLRFGTTTAASIVGATPSRCDDPVYALRTAAGYRDVGIRCVLGVGPPDPFFPHLPEPWTGQHFDGVSWSSRDFTYEDALENAIAVIGELSSYGSDKVRGALHPPYLMGRFTRRANLGHDYSTADVSRMIEIADEIRGLADQLDVQIHTHLFRGSVEFALRHFGEERVGRLLGPNVVIAHANGLKVDEVKIVGATRSNVATAPSTAENVLDGYAPVVELLEAGANVAISTDGSAPRFSFDLWKDIPRAMWHQWIAHGSQAVLPPGKALRMVTIDAARALNWDDEVGSLEAGKRADVVLVNLNQPHLTPQMHVPNLLAFYATGLDVDTVLIDGEIRLQGGQPVGFDFEEILASAREEAEGVARRVDLSRFIAMDRAYWRGPRYA